MYPSTEQLPPSVDSSSFLLLWIQAASSFCGFKQILFLWTLAASSFCGFKQLPPSVDSSNFLLLWTQQIPQIFVQVRLPFTYDESTVQTQLLAIPNFPFQPRCFIGTWNLDLLPTVANIMHLVLHSVFFTSGTPWL